MSTSITPGRRFHLMNLALRWESQLVLLLILATIINTFLSPYFLDFTNLMTMTSSFMERAIVALPLALIIITGNIDLSVESNMAMSAIVMGVLFQAGVPIGLAVVIGLAVGTLGGVMNGLLVVRLKLPSLVATLGTYALFRGIGYSLLGDQTVKNFPDEFNVLGQGTVPGTPIPIALVLFLLLAAIFGLVLHRTSFGRYIYAIGQNEMACRYSGVQVDRIKLILFTVSGLLSALAGIVLAARFGSVRSDIATGFLLDIATAVVLGGVDILGGVGTIVGVVLSLFLLGVVRFGMSLLNLRGQVVDIVVGLLLIMSILLPQLWERLRAARARPDQAPTPVRSGSVASGSRE